MKKSSLYKQHTNINKTQLRSNWNKTGIAKMCRTIDFRSRFLNTAIDPESATKPGNSFHSSRIRKIEEYLVASMVHDPMYCLNVVFLWLYIFLVAYSCLQLIRVHLWHLNRFGIDGGVTNSEGSLNKPLMPLNAGSNFFRNCVRDRTFLGYRSKRQAYLNSSSQTRVSSNLSSADLRITGAQITFYMFRGDKYSILHIFFW